MNPTFDLLGDQLRANWGRRGRPYHVPTEEKRSKIKMLLAFGWSHKAIAKNLGITEPTFQRHYFSEIKIQQELKEARS